MTNHVPIQFNLNVSIHLLNRILHYCTCVHGTCPSSLFIWFDSCTHDINIKNVLYGKIVIVKQIVRKMSNKRPSIAIWNQWNISHITVLHGLKLREQNTWTICIFYECWTKINPKMFHAECFIINLLNITCYTAFNGITFRFDFKNSMCTRNVFFSSFNYIFRSLKFLAILFWHENFANGEKRSFWLVSNLRKLIEFELKSYLWL